MASIVIAGCGWGTALAVMCQRRGHQVTLWSPYEEEIALIRQHGEHKKLLPGVPVPPSIALTSDLSCVAGAELVILAVPSFAIAETARKMAAFLRPDTLVVNAGKGLESGTHRRFSQVIAKQLPAAQIAVLSGPSHAEEVGRGIPTSVVCAAHRAAVAEQVQELLMQPSFRVYISPDMTGVELGGALKNVIALACGICDGMDAGDNTKAALMTRGLAEIARLGRRLGAQSETFAGLSGMGDLIVTCGSMHSRNRRAGILIGQGCTPEEAVRQVGTVEGYHAAKAAFELSRAERVDMPISEQCYKICYEHQSVSEGLKALLERPKRRESEAVWLS